MPLKPVDMRALWLFLALSLIALPCQASFFGSDCPNASPSSKPDWVTQGFKYSQPGFRMGFGEAHFNKNSSYQKLVDEAQNRARGGIADSIDVEITSETAISTQLDEHGGSSNVKQSTRSHLTSSSHITLPGLPIFQKWQDANSCTVYVLIRIAESQLSLVLKKALAEQYFQTSLDSAKPVKTRIPAIKEAIELAKQNTFGDIPGGESSTQLIRRFTQQLNALEELASKNNHVVFIVDHTDASNPKALMQLKNKLISSLPGSFVIKAACTTTTTCLSQANSTPASLATMADVRMNLIYEGGFWIGQFSIELSRWNLSNNHRDYSSGLLSTKVMNRSKSQLTLDKALSKWLKVNGKNLNQFLAQTSH